jgi:hypothetical protein
VDAQGNVDLGYTGTVHFSSSDAKAQLPDDYIFTLDDNGTHTFSATLFTAGLQSITATDTSTSSIVGTQSGINVTAAAYSAIQVAGFPSPTTAGVAGNFTVTAQDAYGNTINDFAGTVTFSSSDSQAQLPDDYAFVANDNGAHVFAATLKTAGTQSITATDVDTGIAGTQDGIVVNAAPAVKFDVSGFPSPATAGTSGSFAVTALDNYGNTVTGYAGTVHFSSSDATATLPGDYLFTSTDNGTHTFDATLFKAGTQSITATDAANMLNGAQTGIVVTPAAPSMFLVAGFPSPIQAGSAGTFTVTVQDAYGNTVPDYTGVVTFSSSDPAAVLPGPYMFTAADNGVHTFGAVLNTVGTQSITASDNVLGITGTQDGIEVVQPPSGGFPGAPQPGVNPQAPTALGTPASQVGFVPADAAVLAQAADSTLPLGNANAPRALDDFFASAANALLSNPTLDNPVLVGVV